MERRERLPTQIVGRYAVFDPIATGGMATVCFGRLLGPAGFARTVVIKRLHPHFVAEAEFAAMFLDEARIAARVHHPNVVPVIDVVEARNEILLVMEYVHGESLAQLARADEAPSEARLKIVTNVVAGALHGLHAAHEAKGENGKPLGIVHRDVSPQNILVGADGSARVLDFGVAKAAGQSHHTGVGQVKGKIRYLSPEQVLCGEVDRRTDVWAASVVLWEALTRKRLFSGENDGAVLSQVLNKPIPSPRAVAPYVPEAVAKVILRGLARDASERWQTALEMAEALEAAVGLVAPREVGAWVMRFAGDRLDARRRVLDDIEAETLTGTLRAPDPSRGSLADLRPTAPDKPVPRAEPKAEEPSFLPDPPTPPVLVPSRLLPETAPATPTLRPPRLEPAPRPARVRLVVAGTAAALVLAVGVGVTARVLTKNATAPVARLAVEEAAPPPVLPDPSRASADARAITPEPSAAPSAPANAPPPRRAPGPSPTRAKPRTPPADGSRSEFRVPLYGRD
jgi:serine/threonine-protein kinase